MSVGDYLSQYWSDFFEFVKSFFPYVVIFVLILLWPWFCKLIWLCGDGLREVFDDIVAEWKKFLKGDKHEEI